MKIVVIGGGLVGRLVQHAVPEAEIYDWRPAPVREGLDVTHPPTFGAMYLWKQIPGITSAPVSIHTKIDLQEPTPERILAYKEKVGKQSDMGDWATQFIPRTEGYRIASMAAPRIHYHSFVERIDWEEKRIQLRGRKRTIPYDQLVSTIPLYSFLKMVGRAWPGEPLMRPIFVNIVPKCPVLLPANTWLVNYWSNGLMKPYRSTFRDGTTHEESLSSWGPGSKSIVPGKIYVTDGQADALAGLRVWLADRSIYVFGRYGTWLPDELLHNTWECIDSWRQANATKPPTTSDRPSSATNVQP